MAWTTPRTWTTSELVTASILNTHVRDNLLETAVAKVSAAGDFVYGSASHALAVLSMSGNGLSVPRWNYAETAMEAWQPNPWNVFDLLQFQSNIVSPFLVTGIPNVGTFADAAEFQLGCALRVQTGAAVTPNVNSSVLLSTGATANTDVGFLGSRTSASKKPACSALLYALTGAASQTVIIGFVTSTTDIATDANDMIGIRISGTGNIFAVVDSAGTETTRDAGSASAVTVGVDVQSTALVRMTRNGTQIGADITTNIPTGTVNAVCGISTQTTANKTLSVGSFAGVGSRNGG